VFPRKPTFLRDQRGVALVEFALVLPVLMLILMGIFDFGRALNYWNDTNQLAADGARLAAVGRNPDPVPDDPDPKIAFLKYVQGRADTTELFDTLKVCAYYGPDFDSGPDGSLRAVGEPVELIVTGTFNFVPLLDIAPDQAIAGKARMRLEQITDSTPDHGQCVNPPAP